MSSPLAIAAVTAVLKDLLNDGLLNHDLSSIGSFSVTATPPDRVTTGQNEPNQLNLFLYQVTPNLGWRNMDLPSRDANGTLVSNAPLAIDLHYLLTAYGSQDLNAEVLLGYAMQLLHENPMLSRGQLRTVLAAPALVDGSLLPSAFGNLSAIDLADQAELIKITPVFLSTEELSKMWTAMQARYRPTMAYMVSVVLIQSRNPIRAAAPVLKRGADDTGPVAVAAPFPTLNTVRSTANELLPAMRLGDDLLLTGTHFQGGGGMTVRFDHARQSLTAELPPTRIVSDTKLTTHLPSLTEDANAMSEWAVGVYSVSLSISTLSTHNNSTNAVPIALSPSITVTPITVAPGDTLTLTCAPRLLPDQEPHTELVFGSQTLLPTTINTPADLAQPTTLTFEVPTVAPGKYLIRLRVERIESLPITIQGSRLDFDANQKVTVT
jgi:hypothetical protein